MNFVDISGFGHSGKSVLSELFKEFDGFNVPDINFEFNLIRIQGGLIDLSYSLCENWSPIRSDSAIRRFTKLIDRIGPSATLKKPISLFKSNGMNYDSAFNNKFSFHSYNYINSLINFKYKGYWPYQFIDEPYYIQFIERLKSNIGINLNKSSTITVSAPSNFISLTKDYLNNLFQEITDINDNYIITHNALEPFNPTKGMSFFENGKIIVVQRDPRDIFSSAASQLEGFIPNFEKKSYWAIKNSFLRVDNVDEFIYRQKLYFNQVQKYQDNENVLRLKFEDIVLNYENTLQEIFIFLGVDDKIHKKKQKYFIPNKSIKNIGLWRSNTDQKIINKIYKELNEFCYK